MNLSMKWLSEFVDISVDAREFAEAMTMSGSKVETTTHLGASVINVVVGKIISIEKHPDADKLQICMVDVAEDAPLQIVTAATNVVVNALVPVAKNGSLLSDGTKIKTGKLRGVTSYGMFCSFHELGLNLCNVPYADEDGILLLQEPCKPGDDIRDVLGLNDSSVEFEITSNRPDCLCVIGLAREVAATFNRPITLHTPPDAGVGAIPLDVTVKAPELCPRYIARMVTDVTIAPSPMWLRARLHASGVRPVNNIVDITNYVLLEYGQPMHAFDANTVSGGGIIVRRAADGESFKTLDGATRTLTSNMLVIADETRALALAGVMGGENSEITSDTHTVIFESATFDAATTRMTARDLGMRTDASALYEKGLDVYNALPAINRACELVEMLGAGKIMQGLVDVFPKMPVPHTLAFEYERINALLGTTLARDEMIKLLASINILENDGVLTIPSFRADVICTADVAEEVARLFGYNNIKSTLMSGESTQGGFSTWQKFKRSMCAASRSLGYSECSTYSFESPKYCDMLMLPTDCSLRRQVKILNPLGDETSVMRTSMLPSMLEVLARNYNNRNLEVDMFELGATYAPKLDADGEIDATLLPDERPVFAFGSYGKGRDFYTLKGVVETVLGALNVLGISFEPDTSCKEWHPGRCAAIMHGDSRVGMIGQIHPLVCANFGIECDVYAAELDVTALFELRGDEAVYRPLPKFPAAQRDLALVCDRSIPVAHLERCIRENIGHLAESVTLFDVYTGAQVPEDKKSVAYACVMRADDRTLNDDEVDSKISRCLAALEREFGATLRA